MAEPRSADDGVTSRVLGEGPRGLQHNFLTGTLEDLVKWARARSSWPATFGLACCAIEMMATGAAHYDLARFGMEVFRASPRQADLMIVAGRVSQKMAPVLRQVYDQMMEPKWVISMGVCASSGGMFNNYAIVQGVDQIVPVDVYAPGLPARPETLIHAILTLHEPHPDRRAHRAGASHRPAPVPASTLERPRPARRSVIGRSASEPSDRSTPTRRPRTPTPRRPRASPSAVTARRSPSRRGQQVAAPRPRAGYLDARAGPAPTTASHMCVDLTAVDYLTRPAAPLPEASRAERFEVVVNLLDHRPSAAACGCGCRCPTTTRCAVAVRRCSPAPRPSSARSSTCSASASTATPTSTRILMPEDWIGHPLRKDYAVGASPCSSRAPRRPGERRRRPPPTDLDVRRTSEGAQEIRPRSQSPRGRAAARGRRGAAHVRGRGRRPGRARVDPRRRPDDDHQHGAAAPQHPRRAAPHARAPGRDGAAVASRSSATSTPAWRRRARTSPTCRAPPTSPAWTTPSPFFNELVFSLAVEQLLGIEVPPRATWIRMLMCELNRMASHLLFLATNGMDIGAVSMMLYGWREREEVLALLREGHRPADEPQLHPPRRRRRRPARRLARRRAAASSS